MKTPSQLSRGDCLVDLQKWNLLYLMAGKRVWGGGGRRHIVESWAVLVCDLERGEVRAQLPLNPQQNGHVNTTVKKSATVDLVLFCAGMRSGWI